MIDNFNLICNYLPTEPVGNMVYQVMVLVRKKDHPHLTHKNNTQRIIYSCIVRTGEALREKKWLLTTLAEIGQARVMINIMPKDLREMCWNVQKTNLEYLQSNQFATKAFRIADTCLGSMKADKPDRLFLWDIDEKEELNPFCQAIEAHGAEIVLVVPTKAGYHVHSKPFNYTKLEGFDDVVLQKNNPTLLYVPESLDKSLDLSDKKQIYLLVYNYKDQPEKQCIIGIHTDKEMFENWAINITNSFSEGCQDYCSVITIPEYSGNGLIPAELITTLL